MSEPYNPRDRIKNHLKRKSTSSRNVTLPATPAPVSFEGLDVNTESCPAPTNNPFRVGSPQKKRRNQVTFCDETEDAQDSFGANYLKVTESQKTPTKSPMKRTSPRKRKTPHFSRVKSFDPTLLQEFHAVDFSQLLPASSSSGSLPVVELESSPDIPVDNRIGGKLRLVSKFPFPWMNTRKSTGIVAVRIPAIERYDAVKYHNRMYISGQEDPSVYAPSSVLALLEASALYYQFPVVPGMTLYPRITSELKNVARVPLPPLCTDTMFTQWVECYEQLFMSYKKGERDHFYVASAVFNVLFTKKSENSEDVDVFGGADETSQSCFGRGQELVALVSHTTSSTREHLRKQGVDYEVIGAKTSMKRSSSVCLFGPNMNTMDCLLTDSRENSRLGEGLPSIPPVDSWILGDDKKDLKRDSDQSEEDENESPTKANADWLKEVGVSPRQVKGVGNARRQLSTQLSERDGISCLLVKGPAVQSLYNTLMTSDIVHEKTGPYTKIPPTLIASSPFLYGQLLSLNKTSQIISKAGSKCSEYVLEMDKGPILPHCTKMLTKFIRAAQLCRDEKTVQVQVADRHTGQGMSDWTDRSTNWNTVTVHEDCVKWTKKE